MKLAVAEATACTCDLVYYVVCIGTRATVASRDRKDSKDIQLARREHAVPQGRSRPENGATNTRTQDSTLHTNTAHKNARHGDIWEKHTRLRCSDQCWRAVEDNVKIVGPRAGMMTGRVSGSINTEMIVDSDRHE